MQNKNKNFSFLTLTGEFCIHFVNIFGEFVHDCNPEEREKFIMTLYFAFCLLWAEPGSLASLMSPFTSKCEDFLGTKMVDDGLP